MTKRLNLKWYQIMRIILPLSYAAFIVLGLMGKNIAIMLTLMGTALFGGAYFCGWLCPFGFLQEWFAKLGRLLKLPHLRVAAKFEKWLRFSRYILFGLSTAGVGFTIFLLSPYGSFMGLLTQNVSYITSATWILLGAFLTLSLFVDRPFCRYFCSEGARYGIVSLGRIFTINRKEENCISCGKCNKKCPVQIEVSTKKHVRNAQCINCFECIAACPVDNTLSYGWAFNKSRKIEEKPNNETE